MSLDVEALRREFPILQRRIGDKPLAYFDNAATTQKPLCVLEAYDDFYRRHNSNVHRGVHTLAQEATDLLEDARATVANFFGIADRSTVIFTRNTTESINLVAASWARSNLKAGDEILVTEMEHHSNLVPWHMAAAATGAVVKGVPLTPQGELDLEAARKLLTPKVKLFAFTGMSNVLGTLNPVKDLIALAKEQGCVVLVDGASWVPHVKVDIGALGADFVAFSAHKMLGPTGVGVLWGRRELLEAMPPFLGGGGMINQVTVASSTYTHIPERFEAGTPHIEGPIAFAAALRWLDRVGMDAVREHERLLTARALELLAGDPDVKVYGPLDAAKRGGIVSFNVGDLHSHDVGQFFDSEGVAIRVGHHCCQPIMRKYGIAGAARASFYVYNTLEEVERIPLCVSKIKSFFGIGAGT